MSNLVNIEIPFSGFYETWHDQRIEDAIEQHFSYDYEKDEDREMTEEMWDAVWSADVDWKGMQRQYAKEYAEAFGEEFGLTIKFDDMTSPREYNFSTDRIFVKVPKDEIDRIRKTVESDPFYSEVIRERFTSRDGFWSNYENDSKHNEWTRDVLDECQYAVILEHYIYMLHRDDPANEQDWSEREYRLTEDFELSNWDTVTTAIDVIEAYMEEK